MKVKNFLVILIVSLLAFLGCQSGGGYQDLAQVKQAIRELRRTRNALEEYRLDYTNYPAEGSNLEVKLAPYLSKLVYSEGKDVTRLSGVVLAAKNSLEKVNEALSGCGRIKHQQIEETYARIQATLKLYDAELKGKPQKGIKSILEDVQKIREIIESLKPEEAKLSNKEALLGIQDKVINTVDSLSKIYDVQKIREIIESLKPEVAKLSDKEALLGIRDKVINIVDSLSKIYDEKGKEHLQNIKNTFEWYKLKLLEPGAKPPEELYSPESEAGLLKEVVEDTTSVVILQQMLAGYRELESNRIYYDFLIDTKRGLERVSKLVVSFEEKREKAWYASIIVQAQARLHRMADALRDYRRETGQFPEPNANTDSILHAYFVEVTMSGERIDRWPDALSWFSDVPVYKTKTPNVSFKLEARVNNAPKTPIFCGIAVESQWHKIIGAFSGKLMYTTPDSTQTYFIKARAKDSGQTWVTDRPPVVKKEAK